MSKTMFQKMKNGLLIIMMLFATQSTLRANGLDDENDKSGFGQLAINSTKYTTAVGIRAIGTSGLTIKHHLRSGNAVEGILGFYPDALSITVLYESFAPAFDVAGLNWYYGLGGHFASRLA